jgi:pyruvate dehydrogenase E1 component
MRDFWQFPNGVDGDRPDHARSTRRASCAISKTAGLLATAGRKVWTFVGDGEMDEPNRSQGLSAAAREGLDNSSSSSTAYRGSASTDRCAATARSSRSSKACSPARAGNVIKLLWGSDWDPLFARDEDNVIIPPAARDPSTASPEVRGDRRRFNREHFFNKYPELQAIVAHLVRRGHRQAAARRPRPRQYLRRLSRRP